MQRTTLAPLLAALVVLAAVAPLGAAAALGTTTQANGTNNSSVNVTVGQQLSTVLAVTSDDVQTDVENAAFEVEYESDDETERAEAVANRAEELRERAEAIREDYEAATEAYEEGELTKSEYAQRLATLNARAENVLASYQTLQKRAANVSRLELRAAGYNRTQIRNAIESLDSVTGTGLNALSKRFVGATQGEIEIETANGLSVSVESDGGETSREFERPGDDSTNITVNQSAALSTARGALTAPANGSWILAGSSIDQGDGTYTFTFRLKATNHTGEAEVTVDGSSGKVVSLEEETERTDADEAEGEAREPDTEKEDERENETEDERELALVVVSGTPEPNSSVTVQALADGEPASNVTVYMDGTEVGTTDANGTITVTLPSSGEVELTAGEGELEFALGEADEDEDLYRNLSIDASLSGDTVSVTATYNGSGVGNATVFANGERVGTTAADGTTSFTLANDTQELELEIVKGEFEAERTFVVQNGSLTPAGDEQEAEENETETEDSEETETDSDSDADSESEETETDSDSDSEETETDSESEETETETESDSEETQTETDSEK